MRSITLSAGLKKGYSLGEAIEYLEKTSKDQRKKHIKPSQSFINEFNDYLRTLKNLSF